DTHDTATFAVWWRDIAPAEASAVVASLQQAGFLAGDDDTPDSDAVLRALLAYLGASRAETVLVNVEDLWLETVPQNVPGTTDDERPNFRRRLARSLDELDALARDEHAPEHAALTQLDRNRRARGGHG